MIYKFRNFISPRECEYWISKSRKFIDLQWENRLVDITNRRITRRVKNFLQKNLKIETTCYLSQIQLWPENSSSSLHIHDSKLRRDGDFNSLIYLNNNFDGGEFLTENQIVSPEPGLLTFFDGSKIYHGVNRVKNNHRYTLIFWWKNTKFY